MNNWDIGMNDVGLFIHLTWNAYFEYYLFCPGVSCVRNIHDLHYWTSVICMVMRFKMLDFCPDIFCNIWSDQGIYRFLFQIMETYPWANFVCDGMSCEIHTLNQDIFFLFVCIINHIVCYFEYVCSRSLWPRRFNYLLVVTYTLYKMYVV